MQQYILTDNHPLHGIKGLVVSGDFYHMNCYYADRALYEPAIEENYDYKVAMQKGNNEPVLYYCMHKLQLAELIDRLHLEKYKETIFLRLSVEDKYPLIFPDHMYLFTNINCGNND